MRTFVRLRQMLGSNEKLIERLDELEGNYDAKFKIVFSAIRRLMNPRAVKRSQLDSAPEWLRSEISREDFIARRVVRMYKIKTPETFKITNCDLEESSRSV